MNKGRNTFHVLLLLPMSAAVVMVLCNVAIVTTHYRTGVAVMDMSFASPDRGYRVPNGSDGYVAACAIAKGEEILADKV
jgi:hypothetical protein